MREYVLTISGAEYKAEVKSITSDHAKIIINNDEYDVELKHVGSTQEIASVRKSTPRPQQPAASQVSKPSGPPQVSSGLAGGIPSPLPGLILDIMVKEGDEVKAGQDIIVMEAMKMENKIQSPHDGVVKKIFIDKGSNVAEGDKLVEITRPMMTTL